MGNKYLDKLFFVLDGFKFNNLYKLRKVDLVLEWYFIFMLFKVLIEIIFCKCLYFLFVFLSIVNGILGLVILGLKFFF